MRFQSLYAMPGKDRMIAMSPCDFPLLVFMECRL
jgi:hypothetical protein